jgi:23S rRNA pseudouridine955/2504/2580 synthase
VAKISRIIDQKDSDIRLDRWFQRHYPAVTHSNLVKLLRKGDIRLNAKKVEAGHRIQAGDEIRLPPFIEKIEKEDPKAGLMELDENEIKELRQSILYEDSFVIAINKKPGLAVQGGSGTFKHLDGMTQYLVKPNEEKPRLVHRLDKDTSGVLLLARSAKAAGQLSRAFQSRETEKTYWAVTSGVPGSMEGKIDLAMKKSMLGSEEKMVLDEAEGDRALTFYRVIDSAAETAALLELNPVTGRTHQLRVHCAALGTPIMGDGKYGGKEFTVKADGVSRKLHLHARAISFYHPKKGMMTVTAPLPEHIKKTCKYFGFALPT